VKRQYIKWKGRTKLIGVTGTIFVNAESEEEALHLIENLQIKNRFVDTEIDSVKDMSEFWWDFVD
jgi:hypothetical protein